MKGRLLCEKNNLPFQIDIYCVKCYMELSGGIPEGSDTTYAICRNGEGFEQINDYN